MGCSCCNFFEAANVYSAEEFVEAKGLDCEIELLRGISVYLDIEYANARYTFSFTVVHL
jgi:hypothetical protein